jgi:hypothetical protein
MKLFLDDREVQTDSADLAGAIAAGCREAEARGRIIVEAHLDGRPLPGEMLADPAFASQTGGEIRLTTAEPRALVLTTLLDVADALEAARDVQRDAAELIQTGQLDAALPRLSEALSVWEQARQVVVHGCELLNISPHTPVPVSREQTPAQGPGVTIAQRADILAGHLGEVKRCIEVRDWTGLADALLYDMDAQAEVWRGVLSGLASIIRESRGA